jgi:hypothetical protein
LPFSIIILPLFPFSPFGVSIVSQKQLVWIALVFLSFALGIDRGIGPGEPTLASPRGQMYVPHYQSGGASLPDWNRITFGNFPSVAKSGQLDLSSLTNVLGYDPSRQWRAGDPVTSVLMLGDFADATNLPTRTLQSILNPAGLSANNLRLADFGIVEKQTFQTLVNAVPSLANYSLDEVPPLYDLVEKTFGNSVAISLRNSPLGQLANGNLSSLPLASIDLSQYGLNSIPGLANTALSQFDRWEETLVGKIPGLEQLPFTNFFTDLGVAGTFALVDIVFGQRENNRVNTVTGSTNVGFHYPCTRNCAHIELSNPSWGGTAAGKQWISGNSQRVSGGSGCLRGSEPTGRHPFGRGFKVVLDQTDEKSGRAEFNIYFRFKVKCGRSPYIIGPFPWMSQYEKDLIFLGLD